MAKKKRKRNRTSLNMSRADFNRVLFYMVKMCMEQMELRKISIIRNIGYNTEDFDITTTPDCIALTTDLNFKDMFEGLTLYMQYNNIYHLSISYKNNKLHISIGNRCSAAPAAVNCLSASALHELITD